MLTRVTTSPLNAEKVDLAKRQAQESYVFSFTSKAAQLGRIISYDQVRVKVGGVGWERSAGMWVLVG